MSSIYNARLFSEKGYVRNKCVSCNRYFWTLKVDMKHCGDQPCVSYTFIDDPPTKLIFTPHDVREKFLSFFERHGHKRIGKYPVVARWREDVYLVGASIFDFQPWVTEGIIPPPANPLVISQPSIRFTDIDLVGKSGRHLTMFEMMAHHAFNYPRKIIYWNDETVDYCFQFLTSELAIPAERVNFIEDMWIGGGNAGEDLEVVVGGIELATLVFMRYKQMDEKLIPLKIRTVDTGYGLERISWLTRKTPTIYDTIFESVIEKVRMLACLPKPDEKIFLEASKDAGMMEHSDRGLKDLRSLIAKKLGLSTDELEKVMKPSETIYAIADFTRTLIFMLGDGVVPSNAGSGYLARLLIRRIIRNIQTLGLETSLTEVLSFQLAEISKDFPEYKEKNLIFDIAQVEEKKFKETLEKGRHLVEKFLIGEKEKGPVVAAETLVKLYDTHGLTPDYISQIAGESGSKVETPEDFYGHVAKLHEKAKPIPPVSPWPPELEKRFWELAPTKLSYYAEPYRQRFEAEVLDVAEKYVVLDKTCFYSEGGGQPSDRGVLKWENKEAKVVDVQKVGNVVVHIADGDLPAKGTFITGMVNWDRRLSLMRNHTGTHILLSAARKVLGEHVWQTGAAKDVERSRLDITHYLRLTEEQVDNIEKLANKAVADNLPVHVSWLPKEEAESKFSFRIYQGGVVPSRKVRIVEVEGWDAEACGGTHVESTGEIGLIKMIRTERIQDGVERIFFATGPYAVQHMQQTESKLKGIAKLAGCSTEDAESYVEALIEETNAYRKEIEKLKDDIAKSITPNLSREIRVLDRFKLITHFTDLIDVKTAIKAASDLAKSEPSLIVALAVAEAENARLIVMAGKDAVKLGADAGRIASEASKAAEGSGGGKPDFAQGGNLRLEKIPEALETVERTLKAIKGES